MGKKHTLKELVETSFFDDKGIVAEWLSEQPTSTIFEMFDEALKRRIRLFEGYVNMVRNNCAYTLMNLSNQSGADKQILNRARMKVLSGEELTQEDCAGSETGDFEHRFIDGIDVIKEINGLV